MNTLGLVVILGICSIAASAPIDIEIPPPLVVTIPFDEDDDSDFPEFETHRFLKLDVKPGIDRNETLSFEDFNKKFQENGFYQFKDFNNKLEGKDDELQTLFVYQPDEDVPELHGYYFETGHSTFIYPEKFYGNLLQYQPFYNYFENEAAGRVFTPAATRLISPEFFEYKLTKFVHEGEVAPEFKVVFLLPGDKGIKFVDQINVVAISRGTHPVEKTVLEG